MTADERVDDPQVLAVAAAISEGVAVDWSQVTTPPDAETTAVLEELRALEGVAARSDAVPGAWGRFTIAGELGHGAYGTVYRAFDSDLRVEVALKVMRPRPRDAARALNEARMLAQVNHPNVVRVFGADRVGDSLGISMELVQGRTLQQLVSREGPLSAREAMLVGVDICCALAAVHGANLVHGDVKAQNVMRATGGRTVLMDFGAGYDAKVDSSAGRHFAGTPMYLAPEVFAGEPRSAVSDIYSVGVLLFYLTTGAFPIQGETRRDVQRQHETQAPRRLLRDLRPDLPEPFIRAVDRAIAATPAERLQTAGELEAALNAALRQDGIAPPEPRPRLRTWPLVLAAAGVLLALGAGYVYTVRSTPPAVALLTSAAAPATAPASSTAAAPAAAPADGYRIEAAFYLIRGGAEVRLEPGARVGRGDQLSLRVTSSVPTYLYVVNEDDRGESYLLFPLPGQQGVNPVAAGTRHEIPGVIDGARTFWEVSSAGGREHFLIFASPEPLSPAFERLFASLPAPSPGARALAQRMPSEMARELRGVGGLAAARPVPAGAPLHDGLGAPLSAGEETARGVWVRQLTLENPGERD